MEFSSFIASLSAPCFWFSLVLIFYLCSSRSAISFKFQLSLVARRINNAQTRFHSVCILKRSTALFEYNSHILNAQRVMYALREFMFSAQCFIQKWNIFHQSMVLCRYFSANDLRKNMQNIPNENSFIWIEREKYIIPKPKNESNIFNTNEHNWLLQMCCAFKFRAFHSLALLNFGLDFKSAFIVYQIPWNAHRIRGTSLN